MMSSPVAPGRILGIDIGGANLKLADQFGGCRATYFPMWTDHQRIAECLVDLLGQLGVAPQSWTTPVAITMTGEMADCFATRRQGVSKILKQVGLALPNCDVQVYDVRGAWLTPEVAIQSPWQVASSNWHALASWILQAPDFNSDPLDLIVDIGSTTIDILPVCDRRLATQAKTDRDRLQQQQLVYTGVQRTAVASILSRVSVAGQPCPLVAETFATSDDAYLVLGLTEESATDCNTADGRPRTLACARARLSRMIGEDFERLSDKIVHSMAQQIVDAQAELVAAAIIRNCQQVTTDRACHILVAGHGAALLREAVARLPFATHTTWLSELVSADAARSAPAVAVAWLLAHHLAVDAA